MINRRLAIASSDTPPPLLRLDASQPGHFGLYETFETRVLSFIAQMGVEVDPKAFTMELRERWLKTPNLAGYFLVMQENRAVAHICAWVGFNYGKPFINIFQAETDRHANTRDVLPRLLEQMRDWMGGLNRLYEAQGQPWRIDVVEFVTPHPPKLWERYFAPYFHCYRVRSIMRFRM